MAPAWLAAPQSAGRRRASRKDLQFAQIPHNVATIDVESEEPHAFSKDIQDLLQACSDVIRPLWEL
jgi:hypothetical protein